MAMDPHPSVSICLPEFIVHRDLKPSNILLTLEASGHVVVRLADFGSAADTQEGVASQVCGGILGPSWNAPAASMAGLSTWVCTVQYAAPEILLGGVVPDPFSSNTCSL